MATGETHHELLRTAVHGEPDVFLVRQRGRQVAAAVGFDGQDQIRVATALSDVGRELVRQSLTSAVVFALRLAPRVALVVELSWRGGPARTTGPGWDTADRLLDEVHVTAGDEGGTVVLVKRLPGGVVAPSPEHLIRVRRELGTPIGSTALDELRAQNQELLETLETLEQKGRELERLNDELEETNRGVVALYKELSEELEETNRGVVALYAELDEKSTQLREAAEARTRFWSNISHELRTPVNSVVGLTRLLAAQGADPLTADQRRQVELINDSGATLLALVNELLDTAKAESGSMRPQPVPVDLGYVVVQLRGALQPMIRSGEVELVADDLPALPPFVTDETMLVRILRNVLSNGLKFTVRGEVRLSVHLAEDGRHLHFVVTDTGIGIPADQQDRVFEEFHQVPGALQVGAGGTGLGLSYARKLARILGGDLALRSEPGRGTEVTLRLPVGALDDIPLTPVGTALLVDGNEESRALLKDVIGDLAHVVVEAADGRTGLTAATTERPGLVFLDADAPFVTGAEILSVLRRDANFSAVPAVVVCTAESAALHLTVSGLAASLLPRRQISTETVRQAVREALVAVRRTVSG
ncbi:ATP-binding protein [Umezawaea beigongshangensis]|uniref:ATP-binding protein n=1 Tax=Umezawaea beigongshangensis TaxID=2780383 RepID=UPI0027DBF17B|nr:ATP-binding protein [Umezawaea beigongshangensis]